MACWGYLYDNTEMANNSRAHGTRLQCEPCNLTLVWMIGVCSRVASAREKTSSFSSEEGKYNMKEHKHLKRLSCVWTDHPCYFITICVINRNSLLASPQIHDVLRKHWSKSLVLHGWAIGQYVIMPDHYLCGAPHKKCYV